MVAAGRIDSGRLTFIADSTSHTLLWSQCRTATDCVHIAPTLQINPNPEAIPPQVGRGTRDHSRPILCRNTMLFRLPCGWFFNLGATHTGYLARKTARARLWPGLCQSASSVLYLQGRVWAGSLAAAVADASHGHSNVCLYQAPDTLWPGHLTRLFHHDHRG